MTTPFGCIAGTEGMSLIDLAERAAARRLAESPLGGLLPGEAVVDLFCGAGGWGEGAKELGITVDFAVNHDRTAILTHERNNPGCSHHLGDAWRARPRDVVGNRTKVGLLMASAACTTHSRARGAAPISKRVHMLGWCIALWMKEVKPRVVLIENVPEWKDWGPTIPRDDGVRVQDPQRKGQHFRRWWRYCVRLGYSMEMRILDAPDYGSASRRRRLFIIARMDGQPIVWPEKTHGNVKAGSEGDGAARCGDRSLARRGGQAGDPAGRDQDLPGDGNSSPAEPSNRCGRHRSVAQFTGDAAQSDGERNDAHDHARRPRRSVRLRKHDSKGLGVDVAGQLSLAPHRTAAEVIDWSDLGASIFERKRPLRPKTLARIAEGIRRYVLNDPQPFVLRVTQGHAPGGGWHVYPSDGPLPTQTTRHDVALCTPVVQVLRGDVAGRSAQDPLPTITAGNGPGRGAGAAHAMGIATPIIAPQNGGVFGQRVDEPAPTITTKGHQSIITPVLATTGYGERDGQAARVGRVAELLGTCVNGVKQAVVSPVLMNNTTHHTGGRVDGTLPTVTTGGQAGLVAPVLAYMNHGGKQVANVDEPLRTVVSGGNHAMLVAALMLEYYGNSKKPRRADEPLGAVTCLDRHGLVSVLIDGQSYVIVDILFRMLQPMELARAMGFRDDFDWPRTKRETVKLIGNAVSPPVARALVGAALPRGRVVNKRERKVRA